MPCSSLLCQFRHDPTGKPMKYCARCKGAEPPTVYCDEKCQSDDWPFHKKYCGKDAYTFRVTLIGSHDPVISRTFDVPARFSFQKFHFAIQYAFDWNCTHLHEFHFANRGENSDDGIFSFADPGIVLKLGVPHPESEWEMPGVRKEKPIVFERLVKLSDVFSESGERRQELTRPDGSLYPLFYMYDFGDHWEHRIEFLGRKLARADRPLFIEASGCAPVDDSGGVHGWEEVKAAFAAARPTKAQKQKMQWARSAFRKPEDFHIDQAPDLVPYNYEGRWENHVEHYNQMERELSGYGNPYVSVN